MVPSTLRAAGKKDVYINEWAMFIAFIVLFFLYAYSITKAWKITRWVRRMKRRARRNKQ